MNIIRMVGVCVVIFGYSLASACSLSLTEWQPLEWNRVSLSGDVVKRVAERLISAPQDFNGAWEVQAFGYASGDESNPEALAEARKQLAIHVVRDVLQVPPERFTATATQVYPKGKRNHMNPGDLDAISISVIPICPPGGCHFCGEPIPKPEAAH